MVDAITPTDGTLKSLLSEKVSPPPYVAEWTKEIASWPSPFPQVWALRVWAHGLLSALLTAAEVGHTLFRDRTLEMMAQLGVPEDRIAFLRDLHDTFVPGTYDLLRRIHWYV